MFELININKKRIDLFFKLVSNIVKDKDIKNILEVGVGSGELSFKMINDLDLSVTMVDIKDQRSLCKKAKFFLVDCSKEHIGVTNNEFDLVVATQVIEHMENITFFANEVDRILKKGGYLLISYPNFSGIYQRVKFLFSGNIPRMGGRLNSGGHINLLPEKFLIDFLSDKYQVEYIEGDALALTGKIPRIIRFFNKSFKDKHIVFPAIKSTLFSYNINILFKKK